MWPTCALTSAAHACFVRSVRGQRAPGRRGHDRSPGLARSARSVRRGRSGPARPTDDPGGQPAHDPPGAGPRRGPVRGRAGGGRWWPRRLPRPRMRPSAWSSTCRAAARGGGVARCGLLATRWSTRTPAPTSPSTCPPLPRQPTRHRRLRPATAEGWTSRAARSQWRIRWSTSGWRPCRWSPGRPRPNGPLTAARLTFYASTQGPAPSEGRPGRPLRAGSRPRCG